MSNPQPQDVPPTVLPATLGVTPDSLAPAAPAVRVPGYEVLAELGRGGMGVVYKAQQTALKRTVALKMILSGEYAGSSERGRFRTEAEAAARLSHPNIVQVFDVNEHQGLPYLSMELCEGGSLAERLRGGALEPRQAAAVVEALARAVHHAHQKGVIHRDLKPANVLLSAECGTRNAEREDTDVTGSSFRDPHSALRVPKITDFGLAKVLAGESNATASGAVLGTPGYMAPEQAAGRSKAIGPAADLYAMGAILYHCLTGRPPFAGTVAETLVAVLERQPERPRSIDRRIDASLEAICLKCLEKAPEDRYRTAVAVADDLRAYLDGEAVLADAHTR